MQESGDDEKSLPRQVLLIPLKTTLETRSIDRVIDVYITCVPIKKASSTLNLIRSIVPNDGGYDLQHLRRFAKHQNIPEHVRNSTVTSTSLGDTSDHILLILAVTSIVSQDVLIKDLSKVLESVPLMTIQVPLLAPTSQEQASRWTSRYWPTVYKKSNPFGPHPSIVSRTEEEIREDAKKWMDLAIEAALQAKTTGNGEEFGVAVIERKNGVARPIAVAGDARWLDWPRDSPGNVTAHAAMRAIAMVANALNEVNKDANQEVLHLDGDSDIFEENPMLQVEKESLEKAPSTDGYLCHGLEIYCTHEPCVMCSMAIVHSRFAKVVFQHRMPFTGGLCADGHLGHGLFWRKELNWTMLAWQYSYSNTTETVAQDIAQEDTVLEKSPNFSAAHLNA
ncbi:cytidine deaminase-like protein [Tricladium varicosporioides]|nr:cytidine deaminase-like protein [Hymenoscyphus varicosporioides]